jgi:hypothetical protein
MGATFLSRHHYWRIHCIQIPSGASLTYDEQGRRISGCRLYSRPRRQALARTTQRIATIFPASEIWLANISTALAWRTPADVSGLLTPTHGQACHVVKERRASEALTRFAVSVHINMG